MKFVAMIILGVLCHLAVAEGNSSIDIHGNTLTRWPRDFKGVAVVSPEVRHIGYAAFAQCRLLTGIVFLGSIETIGQNAFMECDHIQDIRIPSSVTNIGCSAFANCIALTSVVICARIEKIPGSMCSGCYGLKCVEFPNEVCAIGDGAFCGCRSIVNICMPESVKRIGQSAFAGCCRMREIILPKGLQNVDEFAFYGCYDLKRLVFRSVPAGMGVGVFRDCHNLRGYVFSDDPRTNVLYSISLNQEISLKNICDGRGRVGSYGTIEDALFASDKMNEAESGKGLFEGLGQVLRIAADGVVDEMPEASYLVGKIDSLAANLFKLSAMDDMQGIKDYFKKYSSTAVDIGNKLVANLSVLDDIAITVEFHDGKLIGISLSDGLKKVICKKLEKEKVAVDDCVTKWLR